MYFVISHDGPREGLKEAKRTANIECHMILYVLERVLSKDMTQTAREACTLGVLENVTCRKKGV